MNLSLACPAFRTWMRLLRRRQSVQFGMLNSCAKSVIFRFERVGVCLQQSGVDLLNLNSWEDGGWLHRRADSTVVILQG